MFDKFVQWLFFRKPRTIWVTIIGDDHARAFCFAEKERADGYAEAFGGRLPTHVTFSTIYPKKQAE